MDAIRSWLYIGKYRESLNHPLLVRAGIQAMLHLAEHVDHPDIPCLYLPVEDGYPLTPDLLRKGVDFIRTEYEQGHTVLVACGAGVSRSATFTVAALKELENVSLLRAMLEVQQHHRESLPHLALWESLCAYYQEDIAYLDMLHQLKP